MPRKSFGNVLLIAAVLSLGAVTSTPRMATAEERPYMAGVDLLAVGFPCGVYAGSGTATHLGAITESGSYCVLEFVGPGLARLAGEGTQTAANGDKLMFEFNEIANFNTVPFTAVGTFTITGGTGRFAGATGGGTFNTTGTVLEVGFALHINYTGTITY